MKLEITSDSESLGIPPRQKQGPLLSKTDFPRKTECQSLYQQHISQEKQGNTIKSTSHWKEKKITIKITCVKKGEKSCGAALVEC